MSDPTDEQMRCRVAVFEAVRELAPELPRTKATDIAERAEANLTARGCLAEPPMCAGVLRGLQLMRRHLDDGGHDWREGSAMADVWLASEWLDVVKGNK